MKERIRNIEKNDYKYLFTLGFFVVVAIFRYFDEKMIKHVAPWDLLQDYKFNKLAFAIYVACAFLFFFLAIIKTQKQYKKSMYELCAFLSIFAFPMLAQKQYFGAMDLYAWILLFAFLICFISGPLVWFTIPICFIMAYVSPMSILNCGCIVLILFLYRSLTEKKIRYFILMLINLTAEVVGAYYSIQKIGIHTDVQSVLTLERFVLMTIMLSPYLVIAFSFFKGLMKKTNNKLGCVCMMLGSLPSAIVYIMLGDYSRAVIYTFMYYITMVMCFIANRNNNIELQLQETKELIKKWVPIPAVVIAYPLLFITLWIAGPIALLSEDAVAK